MSEPIGSIVEEVVERKIDPNDPPAYGQAQGLAGCVMLGLAMMAVIGFLLTMGFLWALSH